MAELLGKLYYLNAYQFFHHHESCIEVQNAECLQSFNRYATCMSESRTLKDEEVFMAGIHKKESLGMMQVILRYIN